MPAETVLFYEKPGCATNARQKKQLREAGHVVEARDILSTPWTARSLAAFFAGAPVSDWFNKAAPAVKTGAILPGALSPDAAIAMMLADPLLIRRPLLRVGDEAGLGADSPLAQRLLADPSTPIADGCSHPDASAPPCAPPDFAEKERTS